MNLIWISRALLLAWAAAGAACGSTPCKGGTRCEGLRVICTDEDDREDLSEADLAVYSFTPGEVVARTSGRWIGNYAASSGAIDLDVSVSYSSQPRVWYGVARAIAADATVTSDDRLRCASIAVEGDIAVSSGALGHEASLGAVVVRGESLEHTVETPSGDADPVGVPTAEGLWDGATTEADSVELAFLPNGELWARVQAGPWATAGVRQ